MVLLLCGCVCDCVLGVVDDVMLYGLCLCLFVFVYVLFHSMCLCFECGLLCDAVWLVLFVRVCDCVFDCCVLNVFVWFVCDI